MTDSIEENKSPLVLRSPSAFAHSFHLGSVAAMDSCFGFIGMACLGDFSETYLEKKRATLAVSFDEQ